MRKLLPVALCMGLICALTVGLVGCGDKKEKDKEKAKAAATTTTTKPADPAKKTNITVTADPDKWDAEPGAKGKVALKIKREADADKEVKFEAKSDKDGVTATADPVKGDKSEGELAIVVAKDAADGAYKLTVTATSEKADSATTTVTVNVKKKEKAPEPKKEVSISPEKATLKVKQGEKGDSTFKVEFKVVTEATVKQKGDVKGLKVTVDPSKIAKSGDSSKVTVEVAADAKVGDHEVTIEASANGVASSATLTVTVEEKKK